jgi:hypothetical protein
VKDKEREWQIDQSHTKPPFALKPAPPNKGKRKLADMDNKNYTSDKPTKKIHVVTVKGNGREEAAITSQTSTPTNPSRNNSEQSATHTYQLRLCKKVLCYLTEELTKDSDDDSGSDHTALHPPIFQIT